MTRGKKRHNWHNWGHTGAGKSSRLGDVGRGSSGGRGGRSSRLEVGNKRLSTKVGLPLVGFRIQRHDSTQKVKERERKKKKRAEGKKSLF